MYYIKDGTKSSAKNQSIIKIYKDNNFLYYLNIDKQKLFYADGQAVSDNVLERKIISILERTYDLDDFRYY